VIEERTQAHSTVILSQLAAEDWHPGNERRSGTYGLAETIREYDYVHRIEKSYHGIYQA